MANSEMIVECAECGKVFTISAEEKEWYKEKGFKIPKRCPKCRKNRRNARRDEN